MSKRRRKPSHSPASPANRDDWFAIKEIIDERRRTPDRLEYLVDWEPNSQTGELYDPSWISASQVTAAAVAEWQSIPTTSERATRSPQTIRAGEARPVAKGSSRIWTSPLKALQGLPRAVSLQVEERAPKRRRLRHAFSLSLSPVSDPQDSDHQSSPAWNAAPDPRPRKIVVELAQNRDLDRSDYVSVQLSQSSTEGATQSSPHAQSLRCPDQGHVDSQQTIPDSQESWSQDTPNDPRLATESLRAVLGLPQPVVSTSDSSLPLIVSEEPAQAASQGSVGALANSSPDLRRHPSVEGGGELRKTAETTCSVGESSGPSVPSRQPDSFPAHHHHPDGSPAGVTIPCSHSAEHNIDDISQSNIQHIQLPSTTHISESSSSGPQYLTQPDFAFNSLPTSEPTSPAAPSAHPANCRDKDSVIPDSVETSQGRQQSSNSRAADFGSAQSRGPFSYLSQVVLSLPNSSERLTGPDSSSAGEHPVPETVLRQPQRRLSLTWTARSLSQDPDSQLDGRRHPGSNPSTPREVVELVDRQHGREPSATPPSMSGDPPQASPAIAELFRIQQEFLADSEEPACPGSPESAAVSHGAPPPGESQSPFRTLHDPVFNSGARDAHPSLTGSPLPPGSTTQTTDEALALNHPLFPTQALPSDGGASSQAELNPPATVSPSDVNPAGLGHLTVAPSDITSSAELPHIGSRHLPHMFSGSQHAPVGTLADTGLSGEENDADAHDHRLPANEPKEFTVTLPFPANQRPSYDKMIMQSRADIESFCRIFSNEVLRTPKPSAIHKIEALFLKLLDVCDYPPDLDEASWKKMSPKEVQKYLYESNAKFSLIWDMLDLLRELPIKVLIVARSERLLRFLETFVVVEGFAFSRTGLGYLQFQHASSPINVVLALPDQQLPDDPSDFDLVFGFDFEFKRSVVARQLAQLKPAQKHPLVLSLVIAHSLEHLDLSITDRYPDIPELDRKNALVIALTKIRGMVLNPEMGREKPHEIAQHFASLLGGPAEPRGFEPIPLPDSILDVYMDATQPAARDFSDEEDSVNSKKRKLDESEDSEAKRQKLTGVVVPIVDAKRVEALSPLIHCLGAEVLDQEDTGEEVTVPRAFLKAMEAKVNDQQAALEKSKDREKELKRLVTALSQQNDEYARTMDGIQAHHHAAIEERGKFERERDSSDARARVLEARLEAVEEEKARLVAEVADLKAGPAKTAVGDEPTTATAPAADSAEAGLEAALAEVQRCKKRSENAERDLEYSRSAYQTASQSASDLGNENRELAARVADLEHRASENLQAIHAADARRQVAQLAAARDAQAVALREREREVDRLREEVRTLKTRRETRQGSVPRSPRTGVMSPRGAGRAAGVSSRGSSPAPLEAGVQLFGAQQAGAGRWGHLRD